jgi:serine/threonine protein kinase
MSPQMFDKQPYTSKSDIWSLGVTLHELIYKCDPYQAKDI